MLAYFVTQYKQHDVLHLLKSETHLFSGFTISQEMSWLLISHGFFLIFKKNCNLNIFSVWAIFSHLTSRAVKSINGLKASCNLSRSRLAKGRNNHFLVRLKRDCISGKRKTNKTQSGMGFMSNGGCLIRSAGHRYSIKSAVRGPLSHTSTHEKI